jgi:capsular polysaccharide biosynthesis protein
MIVFSSFFESFREIEMVDQRSNRIKRKRLIPILIPGFYLYLVFLNLRLANLSLELPKFYLIRLFISQLWNEFKTSPITLFLNSLLLSTTQIPTEGFSSQMKFKITDPRMKLSIQPFLSELVNVVKINPSSKTEVLFVLDSLTSIVPKKSLNEYFDNNFSQVTLKMERSNQLRYQEFFDVDLLEIRHLVNNKGEFYPTTPFDVLDYEGLPFYSVRRFEGKFIRNRRLAESKIMNSRALFPGYSHNARNYYHFMIEIFPRLLIWKKESFEEIPVIVPKDTPWQIHDLIQTVIKTSTVELDPTSVNYFQEIKVIQDFRFKKLVDINDAHLGNIFLERVEDIRNVKRAIEHHVNDSNKDKRSSNLFLMRPQNSPRTPSNQDVISRLIKTNFDFFCTTLEGLSVTEQAYTFANAQIVVSPQGASLTNLMFCKPSTVVITMLPNTSTLSVFWRDYCKLHNLRYLDLTENQSKTITSDFERFEWNWNVLERIIKYELQM